MFIGLQTISPGRDEGGDEWVGGSAESVKFRSQLDFIMRSVVPVVLVQNLTHSSGTPDR